MKPVKTDGVDAVTLRNALAALTSDESVRVRAATGGVDLASIVAHARTTANELALLLKEVAKFAGDDEDLLAVAESLKA